MSAFHPLRTLAARANMLRMAGKADRALRLIGVAYHHAGKMWGEIVARRLRPNDGIRGGHNDRAAEGDGFVYVSGEDSGSMSRATEGVVIRLPDRGPPWIVVDHKLSSMIVPNWPGRLWRVRIVEPAAAQDQVPSATYTRASSVEILGEEAVATLFGPHGEEVVRVIETASQLSRSQAEALACSRHPEAPRAYGCAWRAWMRQHEISDHVDREMDGALSFVGGPWSSPINEGLSLVHSVALRRAQAVDGDAATQSDGDGVSLMSPWNEAERVLRDAALALGAQELVSGPDHEILMHGWRAVFH